jgi:hypothetical protein
MQWSIFISRAAILIKKTSNNYLIFPFSVNRAIAIIINYDARQNDLKCWLLQSYLTQHIQYIFLWSICIFHSHLYQINNIWQICIFVYLLVTLLFNQKQNIYFFLNFLNLKNHHSSLISYNWSNCRYSLQELIHFIWNIAKLRHKQMGTALTKLLDSGHALETVNIGPNQDLYIYYQRWGNEQKYMNISNKVGINRSIRILLVISIFYLTQIPVYVVFPKVSILAKYSCTSGSI